MHASSTPHDLLVKLRTYLDAYLLNGAALDRLIASCDRCDSRGLSNDDNGDCEDRHPAEADRLHPLPPRPTWCDPTDYGAPDDLLRALADCLPTHASADHGKTR